MVQKDQGNHSEFEIFNKDIETFKIHLCTLLNGEREGALRDSEKSFLWVS